MEDTETKSSFFQSIEKWLTTVLDNEADPVNQALSTEEKTYLQDVLEGVLLNRIKEKFGNMIDQEALPQTLQARHKAFVALLTAENSPTVDTLISGLLGTVDELLQSGVGKLEELALFCVDELYKVAEIIIKLLRLLEVSALLPDWAAQRITGGESTGALSLFLALPKSKLKSLLNAAS